MDITRVYVYGCGHEYECIRSWLIAMERKIVVEAVVTTDKHPLKYIDGYPVLDLQHVELDNADYIIIAVEKWKDIYDNLVDQFGDEVSNRIIRSSAIKQPWFNWEKYIKLLKNGVSILSNNCLGGIIYEQLGFKMLSPTVNMLCKNSLDYIRFLNDWRRYLEMDINPYECDEETHDFLLGKQNSIPKGILDNDIVWLFMHGYRTSSDACKRWNKKRKDVNEKRISAIMVINDEYEAELFDRVNIEKKIGFYYKRTKYSSVVYLSGWDDAKKRQEYGNNWSQYIMNVFRGIESEKSPVDWISFFSGEKNYLRYTI